jgi:hypothetical protein
VRPTQVKKLAREWSAENGALNLRWSLSYPQVVAAIAMTINRTFAQYGPFDEVWVAGGGGTIATGLRKGVPETTEVHVVPIGREMSWGEVPDCIVHPSPPYPMDKKVRWSPPFPCDPYYDAKAWEQAVNVYDRHRQGRRLFWNVIAPPPEPVD